MEEEHIVFQGSDGKDHYAGAKNPLPSTPTDVGLTPLSFFRRPTGNGSQTSTSLSTLLMDDFGGSTLDPLKWDVFDGGDTSQSIGTGVTGITHSVTGSGLVAVLPTTANADKWFLSKMMFDGAEDVTVTVTLNQLLATNSVFVGLVEVDPATGIAIPNTNGLANEFQNRGGADFGKNVGSISYVEAVADNSNTVASVSGRINVPVKTSVGEYTLEFRAEDLHVSGATVDSVAGKPYTLRLSSQVINDQKVYKLLIRLRNVGGASASATTVTFGRILVVDCQENRVEVTSGRGDYISSKALPVNLVAGGTVGLSTSSSIIGALGGSSAAANAATNHKLLPAATVNATSVTAAATGLIGGVCWSAATAVRYLKIYNKASAPTVGTDVPVLIIPIAPGVNNLMQFMGDISYRLSLGLAYAITVNPADADTTALTAGDITILNLVYTL